MAKEKTEVKEAKDDRLTEIVKQHGIGLKLPNGDLVDVSDLDQSQIQIYASIFDELKEIRKVIG